jgi:hypothetical protein
MRKRTLPPQPREAAVSIKYDSGSTKKKRRKTVNLFATAQREANRTSVV